MATHYRSQINFTFQSLEDAWNAVQKINNFVFRLKSEKDDSDNLTIMDTLEAARKAFELHMDDDLDVQHALAALFELIRVVNTEIDEGRPGSLKEVLQFMDEINGIFDIYTDTETKLTDEEKKLIEEREKARKNKDFKRADEIRKELTERNVTVEDSPEGPRWKKA